MGEVIDLGGFANSLLRQHAGHVADSDPRTSPYLSRPKRKAPRFVSGSRVYIPATDETGAVIGRPEWCGVSKAWRYRVFPDISATPLSCRDDELEPETTGPDAA